MKSEMVSEEGRTYIKIPFYREDNATPFFSEYESNILENTVMEGVLKAIKRTNGDETYLMFCVSSLISLNERFNKETLNINMFCDFFEELLRVFGTMGMYLLDRSTICLEPEYIFYNAKQKKYVFLPIVEYANHSLIRYEGLLTFFADVCPVEDKELLEFIFETYSSLNEEGFDEVSFLKDVAGYKYKIKSEEEPKEKVVYEDVDNTNEEVVEKETKVKGTFIVSMFLLLFAFWTSYMCNNEFKYGVVSMAAVLLAAALLGYEVYKEIKNFLMQKAD